MDTEEIRQFVASAQSKTFLEAAGRCNVSASTLTRGVQRLERELGVSLFDRAGRGATLNEAGRVMLPYARRILEEAEAMRREAEVVKRGQHSLPEGHPLARGEELSLADLDGESFLIQAGAGHWQRLVRGALPHSEFKTAGDYILMASLMSSSPLPHFATDRSLDGVRNTPGHVLRRLADPCAHVTYRLAWLASREPRLERWVGVARRVSGQAR